MSTRLKAIGVGVAMMVLPLGYSSVASADTYNFTSCHASSGCGPAGTVYGTVTLTQSGSNVNVSVALGDTNAFILTQSGDDQYFKFNDTGITASNIINPVASGLLSTSPVGLPALQGNQASAAGGFNGDGTGPFSFGIACTAAAGCGMGTSSSSPLFQDLTFTVTNTTLAALETNNGVTIFAADVVIGDIPSQTGPIDASVLASTPLPGALPLFGSVLLGGLGMAGWRKRRARGPVSVLA